MNGQLSIFDTETFNMIKGGKDEDDDTNYLKCFKTELQSIDSLSWKELFSGFNTIKAITFSYDIDFINDLMEYFDYGEIILGGNFMIQKDAKLNELMAEILANAFEAGKATKKYDRLIEMLSDNSMEFRTPLHVLDHRKIYLLKADDGRTRVITGSANMSKRAWNNGHMENYTYDDSEMCYEEYEKFFETSWTVDSSPVPMEVILSKKADDLINGNAILKGIKETGNTIVLQQAENDVSIDNIKFTIDHEAIKEEYKILLDGINPKAKNGFFEILPKNIEKIEHNQKKMLQKKIKVNNVTEKYPSLSLDLYNKEALLDDTVIDLNPLEQEIKHDIDEMISIFNNFNQFVASDTNKLKRVHYKLMNAIFCSPFNAKFRCTAKIKGISTSSLPLFTLISSETSNGGKTFMVKAALKMMTGKELNGVKSCNYSKNNIKTTRLGVKGVPFFIDEIDNSYISRIKDIIKDPEACEDNQIEDMPMLLFASNDVLKPDETIRKRMVFFTIDGALPSTIDKTAYESKGKAIIKKLGTGFYREYLRRMIDRTREELDYIIHSNDISDEYYPDLMLISSEIIISIFNDFGYELPSYMTRLTWKDDYSSDSNADDVIFEIGKFCKNNRKACTFTKEEISIELGTDKNSQKKIESWKNILPTEINASIQLTRDYSKITINRKEFEARLGYKLGGFFNFGKK